MSEKAVRAFLTLWLNRQRKGKVHPLLFNKPQNNGEVSEDEQANAGDRRVEVAKTKATELQDISSEPDGEDGGGGKESDGGKGQVAGDLDAAASSKEPKDDSGRDNGAGVQDGEDGGGAKESDGSKGQAAGDSDAVASGEYILDAPSDVGKLKSQRYKYLQSLCNDPTYQSLLSLLKTVKVCIPVLMT
jgi:hypothetical protein